MQKKFKHIIAAFVAVIAMFTVTSCDKDNVDELTSTFWNTNWTADNGEIYSFYKSFEGVIYADKDDYENHQTDKSFVWNTTSDSKLSILLTGYRTPEGEWKEIENEDYKAVVYDVVTVNSHSIILKSTDSTISLTLLDK